MICHYCGEEYTPSTELGEMFADDDHPACESCLFDVIQGDEIDPLPEFQDDSEGSA